MGDQATTLRVIQGAKSSGSIPVVPAIPNRAISISGGKGGVGKSTVAANLAIAFAQLGARALLVDTDLGMADLNLLLGVAPEKSLLDVLGGAPITEALVSAHGISLLPALNGSYLLSTIGPAAQARVLELVAGLRASFDTCVIDVAAGIGQAQTTFGGAATDAIVVVNPEPLSMADAYACLKTLSVQQGIKHAFVLPNRVTSRVQADEVVARLRSLVARFLDLQLTALPFIPSDLSVGEAAQCGTPLLIHAPGSPAARAIRQLPRALAALAPETGEWLRPARTQGHSR